MSSNSEEPKFTVDQLLEKSQDLVDDGNLELALQLCAHAGQMEADNTKVLLQAATIQLEMGDIEPAYNCLMKCVDIEPDKGYVKYLYLGQLSGGLEAINYFQKGIEIMMKDLKSANPNSSEQKDLKRKAAEAHISITDIYLTDCCFEEDAEKQCEANLDKAIEIDPECPDIYQTYASVRLSQTRVDDAKACLQKSIDLWKDLEPGHPNIPSYDTRISLVRLFLECQLHEDALDLLEALQKENDQSVDLWYLYGWTYFIQGEDVDSQEEKHRVWKDSRTCLLRGLKLAVQQEYDDKALVDHSNELINSIEKEFPNVVEEGEEEDAGQTDTKGDWEDMDSDDEMETEN
ncbi:hypothetical protein H4219_002238 [Mycoemilia scoparia]|uniref:Assembly chaperone of rpl4 n=1 Tax=Mycoemilia scoparia TaxID=417184 RepID=A0A9W8DQW4_9FUNG|nr:hypothetical protein H4219_002238 [Mycoemilia scoparia]